MTVSDAPEGRIAVIDTLRGVAVMGILLANIPPFALPTPAMFSPLAWGGSGAPEVAVWLANFTFIEGKMRALFSMIFGASMLLVVDRARAAGESAALIHLSRMAVLLAIGLAHMYLIWWGDILAHYALIGTIAFLFVRLSAAQLLAASLILLAYAVYSNLGALSAMAMSAARNTPQAIETWNNFAWYFGVPPREWIDSQVTAYLGDWSDRVAWNRNYLDSPLAFLKSVGPETLSAMLLGMAGYRSGFLTGIWSPQLYRRVASIGLSTATAAYLILGANSVAHGFDQQSIYFASFVGSEPFRLLGAVGYAALVILVMRPGGRLGNRIEAVGRAAFTNYLGISMIVTAIFYGWGLGQFARWSRVEIYVVPPLVWTLMLLWSKPWLERYRYGPLEWAWRTLARRRLQPMRRMSSDH